MFLFLPLGDGSRYCGYLYLYKTFYEKHSRQPHGDNEKRWVVCNAVFAIFSVVHILFLPFLANVMCERVISSVISY